VPHPSHFSRFYHPYEIGQGVQIIQLLGPFDHINLI
jgi:hypothetical protein